MSPQIAEQRVIDRKDIPLYDEEEEEDYDTYIMKPNHLANKFPQISKNSSMNGPSSTDEKTDIDNKIETHNFNSIAQKNNHSSHFS